MSHRVDRDVVRAYLVALAPRQSAGLRVHDGRQVLTIARDAPLPWAALERAVRSGRELRACPLSVPAEGEEMRATVLWVHWPQPEGALGDLPVRLSPLGPAMAVRTPGGVDLYWRVHPLEVSSAAAAMGALADALVAVAGDPEEFCYVPVLREQWWAAHPATEWAASDLVAAARLYAATRALEEASRQAALVSPPPQPAPPPSPGEQPPAPAGGVPDGTPWPEAQALLEQVASPEGLDPASALWMAAVRELTRRLGGETLCRALGVEAVGVRGGAVCVLREGRWYEVRVESAAGEVRASLRAFPHQPEV